MDVAREFYKARERKKQKDNYLKTNVVEKYVPPVKKLRRKPRKTGIRSNDLMHAPTWMESGMSKMPMTLRWFVAAAFLSVIAMTTPYWVWVETVDLTDAHFGLWHFCIKEHCSWVHDNLVEGRDIPIWWHMTTVLYFLGTVCVVMVFLIVKTNTIDGTLMMSPTLHELMLLMACVSGLQKFSALYTFSIYFEHTNFLYKNLDQYDFHFSFYCALIGNVCTFCGAVSLIIGEEPSEKLKKFQRKKLEAKKALQKKLFEAQSKEYASYIRQSQTADDNSGHHSDVESYNYHRPVYVYNQPVDDNTGWSDSEDSLTCYQRTRLTQRTAAMLAMYSPNYSISSEIPYY